jgi:hypothetical protein
MICDYHEPMAQSVVWVCCNAGWDRDGRAKMRAAAHHQLTRCGVLKRAVRGKENGRRNDAMLMFRA